MVVYKAAHYGYPNMSYTHIALLGVCICMITLHAPRLPFKKETFFDHLFAYYYYDNHTNAPSRPIVCALRYIFDLVATEEIS